MNKTAIKLLFIYHSSDQLILESIKDHLYYPIKNGVVETEESKEDARQKMVGKLEHADLVLPLMSPSFLKNYTNIQQEMGTVSNLVPILVSTCEWSEKILNPTSVLPDNRLPVSSWELKDKALLSIVTGILKIAATTEPKTVNENPTTSTLSQLEREGLLQQQTILIEKLSYLRKSSATLSDGAKKFELIKDIEQIEAEVKEIQQKLAS